MTPLKEQDVLLTLRQASKITMRSVANIRNYIYSGKLKPASPTSDNKKTNGVKKRGPNVKIWLSDLKRVFKLTEVKRD